MKMNLQPESETSLRYRAQFVNPLRSALEITDSGITKQANYVAHIGNIILVSLEERL